MVLFNTFKGNNKFLFSAGAAAGFFQKIMTAMYSQVTKALMINLLKICDAAVGEMRLRR